MNKEPEHQQIDPNEEQMVHIPGLLSDEFGVSRSEARRNMAMGTVTIDGKELKPHILDVPLEDINGKTLEVKGDVRTFCVKYRHKES